VAWPLILLAQFDEGFAGREGLRFWQVYFITTPHRWITLALVYFDRRRFGERKLAFLTVAAVVVAICLGVRISTGTLTCLLAIDYVWNAWHFAAQHHGIYRIYGRLSEPDRSTGLTSEKWALRLFILYVIIRVAGATWFMPTVEQFLAISDWFAITIPLGLLASNTVRARPGSQGQLIYLISMSVLYLSLLWAVHTRRPALILSLATASALFHAIEYLALVSWSVRSRRTVAGGQLDLLSYLAPRWLVAMGVFLLVLGAGGWLLDQHQMRLWLTINVIVAFLHYAYDGMIWKQRPSSSVVVNSGG